MQFLIDFLDEIPNALIRSGSILMIFFRGIIPASNAINSSTGIPDLFCKSSRLIFLSRLRIFNRIPMVSSGTGSSLISRTSPLWRIQAAARIRCFTLVELGVCIVNLTISFFVMMVEENKENINLLWIFSGRVTLVKVQFWSFPLTRPLTACSRVPYYMTT